MEYSNWFEQWLFNTKGERNTALGDYAGRDVTGSGNIGLGASAGVSVTGETNLAIGISAGGTVKGDHNVALGRTAGDDVIGAGNVATGLDSGSIVRGSANVSYGQGSGRSVTGDRNTAMGLNAGNGVSGNDNVAMAWGAGYEVAGRGNLALGALTGRTVNGNDNIAIGSQSGTKVNGSRNIALGVQSGQDLDNVNDATSLGSSAKANADNAIAIGKGANASATSSIALGSGSTATLKGGVAIGDGAYSGGKNSGGSIVIGGAIDQSDYAPALSGARNDESAQASIVIGSGASNKGAIATVIGTGASAGVEGGSTVIGSFASSTTTGTAIGGSAKVMGRNGTAIGQEAVAYNDGVALGTYSIANRDAGTLGYDPSSKGITVAGSNIAKLSGAMSAVSVGDANKKIYRQITNVAAGTADTDAVNIAQLKAAQAAAETHYFSVNDDSVQSGNYNNDGAQGKNSLVVGMNSRTTVDGTNSVVIGLGNVSGVNNGIAVGAGNFVNATSSVAFGLNNSLVNFGESTAIGMNNYSAGENAAIVGNNNETIGSFNQLLGSANKTPSGAYQSILGYGNAIEGADYNIAVGTNNNITTRYNAFGDGGRTIAIGHNNNVDGMRSGSFGQDGVITGNGSFSFGDNNKITNNNSTALGLGNNISGTDVYALGANNNVEGGKSSVLGNSNTIAQSNTFVIGNKVTTTQANSVVLGNESTDRAATAVNKVIINGKDYTVAGSAPKGIVSVGSVGGERQVINVAAGEVSASSTDAVNGSQLFATNKAIADSQTHYVSVNDNSTQGANYNNDGAKGKNSIAIGIGSKAENENSVSIGTNATSNYGGIAIGSGATASNGGSTAIGINNVALANNAHVFGANNRSEQQNSSILGNENQILTSSGTSLAIGNNNTLTSGGAAALGFGNQVSGAGTLALGNGNNVANINATAVGLGNQVLANGSTALGTDNNVTSDSSGVVGRYNTVQNGSVAYVFGQANTVTGRTSAVMGISNTVANSNTFVLGNSVKTTQNNSVVLGNESTDRAATTVNKVTINGKDYTVAGTGSAGNGIVSVGKAGGERQIINVAAGEVSASSTDAVNGSQLYATNKAIADSQTHYVSVNDNSTQGANYNNDGATGKNSLAIGVGAKANGDNAVAIGSVTTDAANSIAIGNSNVLSNTAVASTAIGSNNTVTGNEAVALGSNNIAKDFSGVAVGSYNNAEGYRSIAVGAENKTKGQWSSAFGVWNEAEGERSSVLGANNKIQGRRALGLGVANDISTASEYSSAIGAFNKITDSTQSLAAGYNNAITNAKNSTVLGNANKVEQENTQVLGNKVTTTQANSVVLGNESTDRAATAVDKVTINGEDYSVAGTATVANGVVSVGKVGGERQIINVAAGEVSASSTDAINGSQLYATNQAITEVGKSAATAKTEVVQGDNMVVTESKGANGQSIYNIATAKEVNFNKTTVGTVITDSTTGKITGLTAGEVSETSTDAVNGSQLYATNKAIADSKTHYVSINDNGNTKGNYNNDAATGLNSVAIGTDTSAKGTSSIAMGDISNASGNFGIAMGYGARALGLDSLVVGKGSEVSGGASTTLGAGNAIAGNFSTAVGAVNRIDQDQTVVLGNFVTTTQANSVVLGNASTDRTATAVNKMTINSQDYAVAGTGSAANGVVSVGKVGGERQIINVAAGEVSASSTDAINGSQLYSTNQAITEVGKSAAAAKTEIAQGDNIVVSESKGANGQSIYNVATAKEVNFNKTTVGTVITDSTTGKITGLTAGEVSKTSTDAVNGSQLYATNKAIADSKIHYVSVNDDGTQAANYNNDGATGKNAVAMGVGASAAGENAIAIGNNNKVVQNNTSVLGSNVTTTQANSVVLGNASTDRAATSESKVTILGQDYAFAGVGSAANGVVSVGKVGGERQIINVAAGQLSATSTDAVNGSQLYATNQAISSLQGQVAGSKSTISQGKNTTVTKTTNADGSTDYQVATKADVSFDSVTVGGIKADAQTNKITGLADGSVSATSSEAVNGSQLHGTAESVATALGGNAKVNADGTISTSNIGNTGKDNVHDAIASIQGQVAGSKTSVSAGKNTVVSSTTNANGSNNYQVALADDIKLNSVTANQVTANQVTPNQVMANQVNVGKVAIDGTTNKVSGLANGTISKDSTDAVNGSQLHQTNSHVSQYLGGGSALNPDGTIAAPTYKVAGATYHNVGDALGAVDARVTNLEQAFYNTNKNMDDLRNDAYAGIAGAMAVGNLPQPTEAGMSMMSAGLSGYRGETAVAVGISAITDSNKIVWKMGASADSRSNIGGAVSVGYQWK